MALLNKHGVVVGKSRLALSVGCKEVGLCLSGCPFFSIFQADRWLEETLQGESELQYLGGREVVKIHGNKLSGAASGGASFIVHPNSQINSASDFKGKKIATPQIGGGYLIWLWLRHDFSWILGGLGGFVLFLYGIVPTFLLIYPEILPVSGLSLFCLLEISRRSRLGA